MTHSGFACIERGRRVLSRPVKPRTAKVLVTLTLTGLLGAGAPAAGAATATDEMVSCAALGAKRPGTAADRAMGDRLIERFRAGGLTTSAEDFHMPVWKSGATTLTVAAGNGAGTTFDAQSFPYSGTGTVDAPVVDVGTGMPSDFDGKDVRGKLVLVDNGGTYHRTVQVENIMARGGAGMIYVSTSPKNLIQTGSVRWGQRPPASIPAVTVGADTGAAIRARLAAGATSLHLAVQGERVDALTRNIVGIRRGTTYPDRYVVVAGHYDSWYAGANDNCTAVGTLLSTVEANKDIAPAYTMIYIGWGAEEPGLVGSYTWLWRHQDLVPRIAMNINLEETATATFSKGVPTSTPSPTLTFGSTAPAMVALATAAQATSAVVPPVVAPVTAYRAVSGGIIATDFEGFYAQGVQAVSTASSSPYYHTTGDTADNVNAGDLERATAYITQLTRTVQAVPPAALTLREVPKVAVHVPASLPAGAAVPVEVTITDAAGQPVSGDRVLVLADQRDNWAVAEGVAEKLGGGRYRFTVPAGATDAGLTRIRATTSAQTYLADGFATVDQTRGGVLPAGPACRSRRVVVLHVPRTLRGRRVLGLRVSASRGRVRVTKGATRYTVRLDLRKLGKGSVRLRLTAATARGHVVQTRTYRTCTGAG